MNIINRSPLAPLVFYFLDNMVDATDTILRVSRDFDDTKKKAQRKRVRLVDEDRTATRNSNGSRKRARSAYSLSDGEGEEDDVEGVDDDTENDIEDDANGIGIEDHSIESGGGGYGRGDRQRGTRAIDAIDDNIGVRARNDLSTARRNAVRSPLNSSRGVFPHEVSTFQASNSRSTSFPIPRYELVPYDETNYFARLMAVLTYSDRHGCVWMGIQSFLDLYFTTVFNIFFGNNFDVRVVHIHSDNKFSAKFSLYNVRAYKVIILMNHTHWDRVLDVATAMPDIYFRRSDGITSTITKSGDRSLDNISQRRFFDMSVMALCLVHRLEMLMFSDIRSVAPHVVTLGRFFANDANARNPFVVKNYFDA